MKTALEAEVQNMAIEAINKEITPKKQTNTTSPRECNKSPPFDGHVSESLDQRLDAIYDQEPLGFEKDT